MEDGGGRTGRRSAGIQRMKVISAFVKGGGPQNVLLSGKFKQCLNIT